MPQAPRLDVLKTYKLYVNGAFPRSESGRSEPIKDSSGKPVGHACKASRKDLRDAVGAARSGLSKWKGATAYNRSQVMYRMAEMLQGKRAEFVELLSQPTSRTDAIPAAEELELSVDRLVYFAGWCDKFQQVLGAQNPVAGPYWNISTPEPTGVVGIVCPLDAPLLGLVSLVAPVICAGNTAVAVSPAYAPVVSTFGEVCATSDLPPGVVNLLTGVVDELAPVLAGHRDCDALLAISGTISDTVSTTLRQGAAENLKRVRILRNANLADNTVWQSHALIEPFVEIKTVWHPVGS